VELASEEPHRFLRNAGNLIISHGKRLTLWLADTS